jgi:hypothetical protein
MVQAETVERLQAAKREDRAETREVDHKQLKVTMNRLELTNGKAVWTQPDSVTITVPAAASAKAAVR